jgi:serine/threonine-protein kinase RsbW
MSERRINVPARYDRIKELSDFVVAAAQQAGLDESAVFHCQIAVDEACTNIIEHGYDGEDKGSIEIVCRIETGALTMDLFDDAKSFDVTQVPDPQLDKALDDMTIGGLGVYFMKKTMNEVAFEHKNGRNHLTLVKRIAQSK